MVEVFRTNVTNDRDASKVLASIHEAFVLFEANFDLQDCDRILRVKSITGPVYAASIIQLVNDLGFYAEVLPDNTFTTEQGLASYARPYFQLGCYEIRTL